MGQNHKRKRKESSHFPHLLKSVSLNQNQNDLTSLTFLPAVLISLTHMALSILSAVWLNFLALARVIGPTDFIRS